jgi:beta-lactamase superfamily II metal-dependent hydrolase
MVPAYATALTDTTVKKRKNVANLFVGEWAEMLETAGQEAKVNFRGGEGYVPLDALGSERVLELYFMDVGQGDSILIQTADDKRVLIDGGKDYGAYSFIKWKYHLEKYVKDFEAVIMTHGDEDHSGGLLPILNEKQVLVKRIYHNGLAKRNEKPVLGKTEKVNGKTLLTELYSDAEELKQKKAELTSTFQQWVDAVANAKANAAKANINLECIRADQNTAPLVIGEKNPLKITFVNPINLGTTDSPRLKDFGSDAETINGNSVGVLLEYGMAKILLCGDMNEKAEKLFLQNSKVAAPIAQVFKANHHGSQDFSCDFLKAVQPWVTVVSSGGDPDYGHPRACLLGSLGRYASNAVEKPLLFSTEVAATFKKVETTSADKAPHLYEKTTRGLINVRTNGAWLAAGRVYNVRKKEKAKDAKHAKGLWDWEKYAFDLKNAKPLTDALLTST